MDDKTSVMEIIRLMKKIMMLIKGQIDSQLKQLQLTEPQGLLIRHLLHQGQLRVSDLSDRMDLSNSTVSGIIDRLEEKGIVERQRSQKDRRVVFIALNEEYKKNTDNFFCQAEKRIERLMGKSSQQDLKEILNALEKMHHILICSQELNSEFKKGERDVKTD